MLQWSQTQIGRPHTQRAYFLTARSWNYGPFSFRVH